MRSRRLLVALTGGLVALALLVSGLASANAGHLSDPRDPRTPLDIASLSYRLSGKNLVWTLRTYKPFSSKILKSGSIDFKFRPPWTRYEEGSIIVYWSDGKLVGQYCRPGDYCHAGQVVPVARPDSSSVKVTVPLRYITDGPAYRLAAGTFFQGKYECRKGCRDRAPNRGFRRHILH